MPKLRRDVDFTPDTSSFTQAIENFVNGRVIIFNPTITDYLEHYGSKKDLASYYAETNGLKYDTARKQIERMMKAPDMKLKRETIERLGRLQVNEGDVVISIRGWFTYDFKTWEYNTFSNVRKPFSAEEMREIISVTRSEGEQAGIVKFLELYGVDGLVPTFAKQDLEISIIARIN